MEGGGSGGGSGGSGGGGRHVGARCTLHMGPLNRAAMNKAMKYW